MTTPSELAAMVDTIVAKAQSRVGPDSIGAQQYYVKGEPQRFEVMDFKSFLDYFEEEALDIINYGVMLCLKIDRLRELADEVGIDRTP